MPFETITDAVLLVTGILLLTTGRKLVWLLFGLIGFSGGLVASRFILKEPETIYTLVIGLAAGVLAVLLVKFIKNLILGAGGFILGAFLANSLLTSLKAEFGILNWVIILVAGVLCAFFILSAFEFALKLITSLAGAVLITRVFSPNFAYTEIIFVVLVIAGIIFQSRRKNQDQD